MVLEPPRTRFGSLILAPGGVSVRRSYTMMRSSPSSAMNTSLWTGSMATALKIAPSFFTVLKGERTILIGLLTLGAGLSAAGDAAVAATLVGLCACAAVTDEAPAGELCCPPAYSSPIVMKPDSDSIAMGIALCLDRKILFP